MGGGFSSKSSASKKAVVKKSDAVVISVTLKKPLGVSIGDSTVGGTISGIDPTGNAAEWNKSCADNEFDAAREIRVGDVVVAISSIGKNFKDVSTANWSPMQILDFFSTKTGPEVTIKLQRSEMSPTQLSAWLKQREGRTVYEPMPLPIRLTLPLTSPLGLKLDTKKATTGSGAVVREIMEGSAATFNAAAEKDDSLQRRVCVGDMITGYITNTGVTVDLRGKDIAAVEKSLASQKGQFSLQLSRPIDATELNPRTLVVRVCVPIPTGLVLQDEEFGTIVGEIEEGGNTDKWNKGNPNSLVEVGDYVIGIAKLESTGDDATQIQEFEGVCHEEIIQHYNSACKNFDGKKVRFNFKRTFHASQELGRE